MVKILDIFGEVLGDQCGKLPCYNTVENWVKKLGLSVYEQDRKASPGRKIAMVIDESIFINKEKLLLLLGIPAEFPDHTIRHEDVTVLDMKVGSSFTGEDIREEIESTEQRIGTKAEYVINDQGRNLLSGVSLSERPQHIDISHAMGSLMKRTYGKCTDFLALTELLGDIRLKYNLTDKAYLLPPNMRALARFMNMSFWVEWGISMLGCFPNLPQEMQEAYSFVPENRELFEELASCIQAIKFVEDLCKNNGFSITTCHICKGYIVRHVIANANPRKAMLGIRMLDYFDRELAVLNEDKKRKDNISSDIIESTFGIYKGCKSPNKLCGITPLSLMIPLYPKLSNKSTTEMFNFKDRLVNVKLKDIYSWANQNMSTNWVRERTKTLRNVS